MIAFLEKVFMETTDTVKTRAARGRWMFWVGLLMVIGTAAYW